MGCEMEYVDSDNIPVALIMNQNVVDVNIVRGIFPEEAGHVAPVNTAS